MHDKLLNQYKCPRCGYDLLGISTQSTVSTEGTCAECGLDFLWEDLRNHRRLPKWYVEAEDTWLGGVLHSFSTIWRIVPPLMPWSKISLEACAGGIRWRAMAGWVMALMAAAHLSAGLVVGSEAASRAYNVVQVSGATFYPGMPGGTPTQSLLKGDDSPAVEAGIVLMCGVIDPVAWFKPLGGRAHRWMNMVRTPSGGFAVWGSNHPPPWRYTSRGMLFVWGLLIASMLAPLVFIVLPVTRRRAKVLPSHLIRVWLLSLHIPLVAFMLLMAGWAADLGLLFASMKTLSVLLMFASFLAFAYWWMAACQAYLRLSAALAVAISVLLISFLGAIVGTLLINESWLSGLFFS